MVWQIYLKVLDVYLTEEFIYYYEEKEDSK